MSSNVIYILCIREEVPECFYRFRVMWKVSDINNSFLDANVHAARSAPKSETAADVTN